VKLLIKPLTKDPIIFVTIFILLFISLYILNSLSPEIFPQYYLYVGISYLIFFVFYLIGFEIVKYFTVHLYVLSLVLLILTLVLGSVTRGTVRWISIGGSAFQASEIVRPFLLLFYAKIVSESDNNINNIIKIILSGIIPVILIAIQPSLGVSIITFVGLMAIFASKFLKGKGILILVALSIIILPITWFSMKPYQKERITVFLGHKEDPKGSGYNAIQSIISVGSGGLLGRGFKKGFQTQLEYLPEKHTDFIFAGISEEMGFIGSFTVLALLYFLFYRMLKKAFVSGDGVYKLFTIGVVVVFLVETIINIGMNIGILPITGLPLPFVSAGGSSLLSSMLSMALVLSGSK